MGNNDCRSASVKVCPDTVKMEYAVPRSTRRTECNPQLRAMSVAFDDHGDSVPIRGVTNRSEPLGGDALAASP